MLVCRRPDLRITIFTDSEFLRHLEIFRNYLKISREFLEIFRVFFKNFQKMFRPNIYLNLTNCLVLFQLIEEIMVSNKPVAVLCLVLLVAFVG